MTSHIDNTNPLFAGKSIPKINHTAFLAAILEQFLILYGFSGRHRMVGPSVLLPLPQWLSTFPASGS